MNNNIEGIEKLHQQIKDQAYLSIETRLELADLTPRPQNKFQIMLKNMTFLKLLRTRN
jgi:hypothetical protein